MNKFIKCAAVFLSLAVASACGCAPAPVYESFEEYDEELPPVEYTQELPAPTEEMEALPPPQEPLQPQEPAVRKLSYIMVTAENVNIRSGADTSYRSLGKAEKSTLYRFDGHSDGWYKTVYREKPCYISSKYCTLVEMEGGTEDIEEVISKGCETLGTPYVYGAVRLHDGKGNMYRGFTSDEFDCSSLMQYIFYRGAGKILQVNTRTQIYQGTTVTRANLKRGDLMFFTNASRKNNYGIERVGHVALYLGDNYILHTASDYAKIEQISSLRWSYFIQSQRII